MSTDFVTVKEAAKRFGKSEKTIYRLIDRVTSDATNSDRHHVKPAPKEITALTEQRKKIKYAISLDLLTQRFGQPTDDHAKSQQPVEQPKDSTAINSLYNQRIDDLKDQLKQAHQREKELKAEAHAREAKLLDYAQADKQLFAKANENLTQVLALPGITEATRARQGSTVSTPASSVVDTTPKPVVVTQKPRPKSTTKTNTKQGSTTTKSKAKKEPARATATASPSRLRRFFFGGK